MSVSLRYYKEQDFDAIHEMISHSEVKNRINAPVDSSVNATRKYIETRNTEDYPLIVITENDSVVGHLAWNSSFFDEKIQFGYCVSPDKQRRGIGTKAVQLFTDKCISNGSARIQAIVQTDNFASVKTLERAGYSKEGLLKKFLKYRDVLTDVYMYARVAD